MRSSSSAAAAADDSSLGSLTLDGPNAHAHEAAHDADIDEFSDGLTTQDDGGESTEPEHPERNLYFGGQQFDDKKRYGDAIFAVTENKSSVAL